MSKLNIPVVILIITLFFSFGISSILAGVKAGKKEKLFVASAWIFLGVIIMLPGVFALLLLLDFWGLLQLVGM